MSKELQPRFLNNLTPPSIFTLICLSAIGALAMNIFLPSLPAMAETFDVTYAAATLSVTLFLAMNAVFQLFVGPLSDRFGRRPIVLASLIIFCFSSFGCILATSFEIFLVCRLLQSVVVAGLVLSRAAIRDVHSQDQAASVIGYVTMGMAILPLIGPAVGGGLEVQFGWIASFWVLFGIGIFVFVLAYLDMGETNKHRTTSMVAQFQAYPELLSSRRFWGYCLTATFSAGAYFAYLGGAAYVGREIFSLSPAVLGFYLGAPAIGYIIGNGLSGKLSVAVGVNKMILTGTLITALGMLLCISLFLFTIPIPLSFFGCVSFMGIGNGMVLPNSTSGMMSVRPHLAGSASGIGGTINTAGGASIATATSAILIPGTGTLPLLFIMLASTILSVFTITYVIKRTKDLSIAN
jgi:DHA1 family bicyclomycin/chloramphenicol resistance-like MFS transporter|tara:strand:- start:2182 stop:3402 length:1221 start_codon:yes stop_codon:yes gene_type:complete